MYAVTPESKQEFLKVYDREHETTMKVLRAYPEDKLDFKAHPTSKSARELAWIFVLERRLGTMLQQDAFAKEPPAGEAPKPPQSWQEQLAALEKAHKEYRDLIESTPEKKLSETARFFVGPKTMGDIPRLVTCWWLLHDQIHHRGQFSVYLRMVGGKVPSIYGPSLDEPWF
jgi:uncharacterized damage-inducible protein DinB